MSGPMKNSMNSTVRNKRARAILREFLNQASTIKKGDFVVRNALGSKKYSMPNDNQAAICMGFARRQPSDREGAPDMLIAVTSDDSNIMLFWVNSRFYALEKAPPKNLIHFRKTGE